jgi:hypothetical protein
MQSFTCCNNVSFWSENLPIIWIYKSIGRKTRCWTLCFVLFAVIFAQLPAFGSGGFVLAWHASTNQGIAGYNIYYGGACRTYTNMICSGTATNVTLSGMTQGATYFIAVTAFTPSGMESPFSNEVQVHYANPFPAIISIQPVNSHGLPTALLITTTAAMISNSWTLQSSSDLKTWTSIKQGTNLPVNTSVAVGSLPMQFFRLLSQ